MREKDCLLVDFKTHATPPLSPNDTPQAYLHQIALYHAVLEKIYPEKSIKAALLWTRIPRLDILPPSLLKKFLSLEAKI